MSRARLRTLTVLGLFALALVCSSPSPAISGIAWTVRADPAEYLVRCETTGTLEDEHNLDTLIGVAGRLQSDVVDVINAMLEAGYTSSETSNELRATLRYKLVFEQDISFRGKKAEGPQHQILLGVFRKERRWRAEINPRYRSFITPDTERTIALAIEDWARDRIDEVASERERLHETAYTLTADEIRSAYQLRKPHGRVERGFTFKVCDDSADGILRAEWTQEEFQ